MRNQFLLKNTSANDEKSSATYRHYVCPYLFVTYNISARQGLQLSYSSNINKPTLTSLNPNRLYIANDVYRIGNPQLKESYHYMVNLSYWFDNLQIQPYIEWLDNGIGSVVSVDGNSQIYTWDNSTNRRTIGMMVYYAYTKLNFMRASVAAFITNPTTYSSNPQFEQRVSAFQYLLQPRITFYLDKNRKYALSLYGSYISKDKSVEGEFNAQWSANASFSASFNEHWSLSLSGKDLLHSKSSGYKNMGDSKMYYNNKYVYTGVELTLSYSFGINMRQMFDRSSQRQMNMRTEIE